MNKLTREELDGYSDELLFKELREFINQSVKENHMEAVMLLEEIEHRLKYSEDSYLKLLRKPNN